MTTETNRTEEPGLRSLREEVVVSIDKTLRELGWEPHREGDRDRYSRRDRTDDFARLDVRPLYDTREGNRPELHLTFIRRDSNLVKRIMNANGYQAIGEAGIGEYRVIPDDCYDAWVRRKLPSDSMASVNLEVRRLAGGVYKAVVGDLALRQRKYDSAEEERLREGGRE